MSGVIVTMRNLWVRFRVIVCCRLLRRFVLHRFELVQAFDQNRRKLYCVDCETYFAMDDAALALFPWNEEYEDIICLRYDIPRTNR